SVRSIRSPSLRPSSGGVTWASSRGAGSPITQPGAARPTKDMRTRPARECNRKVVTCLSIPVGADAELRARLRGLPLGRDRLPLVELQSQQPDFHADAVLEDLGEGGPGISPFSAGPRTGGGIGHPKKAPTPSPRPPGAGREGRPGHRRSVGPDAGPD